MSAKVSRKIRKPILTLTLTEENTKDEIWTSGKKQTRSVSKENDQNAPNYEKEITIPKQSGKTIKKKSMKAKKTKKKQSDEESSTDKEKTEGDESFPEENVTNVEEKNGGTSKENGQNASNYEEEIKSSDKVMQKKKFKKTKSKKEEDLSTDDQKGAEFSTEESLIHSPQVKILRKKKKNKNKINIKKHSEEDISTEENSIEEKKENACEEESESLLHSSDKIILKDKTKPKKKVKKHYKEDTLTDKENATEHDTEGNKRKVIRAKRILRSNVDFIPENEIFEDEHRKMFEKQERKYVKAKRIKQNEAISNDEENFVRMNLSEEAVTQTPGEITEKKDTFNHTQEIAQSETLEVSQENIIQQQDEAANEETNGSPKQEIASLIEEQLIEEVKQEKSEPKLLDIIEISDSDCSHFDNQKLSSCISLTVDSLPSSISPSNATDNHRFETLSKTLSPSLSGAVEVSKRRTYELEDSTIDISLLKSTSEKDSFTPSKVTIRKRWSTATTDSPMQNALPKWVTDSGRAKLSTQKKALVDTERKGKSKVSSKKKVPNFAAIHARAQAKMENLQEYKERKEKRAQMLLSGHKPEKRTPKTNEFRKQLKFAPNSTLKEQSPTYIPLPTTPYPKKRMSEKSATPLLKLSTPLANKSDTPETPSAVIAKKINALKNEPKLVPMRSIPVFNFQKLKNPSMNFNFGKKSPPKASTSKHIQRTPFKAQNDLRAKGKLQILKKSKGIVETVDTRRCTIKGVRSNRRFELLMQMRKGK